jgi:flagellar hook-associated protein 2
MAGISFSGIASGIDGDAIIKATTDAKRLAYRPLENSISDSKRENTALEALNTKLLALFDSLQDFRTLTGNGITKAGTTSQPDTIGISVSTAAPATSTTVTVDTLAKGATFSFNDRFSSIETPIAPGISGTEKLTVTVGQGDDAKVVEVNVTNETSLREIVEQLNGNSEGKLSASAVNLGTDASPQFALVIASTETGVTKSSLSVAPSVGLTGAGLFNSSTLEQAQDAVFTIAGIGQITRPSNKISGIIPGVTLELKQANSIPVQVTVVDDREKTADKFGKIVTLINELIAFSKDKSKIESQRDDNGKTTNVFSDLAKTRLDDQAVTAIKEVLGEAFGEGGKEVRVLADLGLTTKRDGTLDFDKDKFLESLAKDPIGGAQILNFMGDKLATTDGVISQYTKFQGLIDSSKTSNDDKTKILQDRIDKVEDSLAQQTQSLKLLFAGLEERISKLNSSANSLSSLYSSASSK